MPQILGWALVVCLSLGLQPLLPPQSMYCHTGPQTSQEGRR